MGAFVVTLGFSIAHIGAGIILPSGITFFSDSSSEKNFYSHNSFTHFFLLWIFSFKVNSTLLFVMINFATLRIRFSKYSSRILAMERTMETFLNFWREKKRIVNSVHIGHVIIGNKAFFFFIERRCEPYHHFNSFVAWCNILTWFHYPVSDLPAYTWRPWEDHKKFIFPSVS